MGKLAGGFVPAAVFGVPVEANGWYDRLAVDGEIRYCLTLSVDTVHGVPLARVVRVEVEIGERDLERCAGSPALIAELVSLKYRMGMMALAEAIETAGAP